MNKEFIPYEQALELKELGFDDVCLGYYHTTLSSSDVDLIISKTPNRFYHLIRIPEHFDTLAPLYQQVFRWFRDNHGIMYTVDNNIVGNTFHGSFTKINADYESDYTDDFATYEEAEIECLKKLIKIVKNK